MKGREHQGKRIKSEGRDERKGTYIKGRGLKVEGGMQQARKRGKEVVGRYGVMGK